MAKGQHFAEEALGVAERLGDAARLVGGHQSLGGLRYWQGKRAGTRAASPGLRAVRSEHAVPGWPGSHPGVQSQFYVAVIYWMLGYPDRSLEEAGAARKSVEALDHPLTLAQRCATPRSHPYSATSRRRPSTMLNLTELRWLAEIIEPPPFPTPVSRDPDDDAVARPCGCRTSRSDHFRRRRPAYPRCPRRHSDRRPPPLPSPEQAAEAADAIRSRQRPSSSLRVAINVTRPHRRTSVFPVSSSPARFGRTLRGGPSRRLIAVAIMPIHRRRASACCCADRWRCVRSTTVPD
jgi:hypothetical protein